MSSNFKIVFIVFLDSLIHQTMLADRSQGVLSQVFLENHNFYQPRRTRHAVHVYSPGFQRSFRRRKLGIPFYKKKYQTAPKVLRSSQFSARNQRESPLKTPASFSSHNVKNTVHSALKLKLSKIIIKEVKEVIKVFSVDNGENSTEYFNGFTNEFSTALFDRTMQFNEHVKTTSKTSFNRRKYTWRKKILPVADKKKTVKITPSLIQQDTVSSNNIPVTSKSTPFWNYNIMTPTEYFKVDKIKTMKQPHKIHKIHFKHKLSKTYTPRILTSGAFENISSYFSQTTGRPSKTTETFVSSNQEKNRLPTDHPWRVSTPTDYYSHSIKPTDRHSHNIKSTDHHSQTIKSPEYHSPVTEHADYSLETLTSTDFNATKSSSDGITTFTGEISPTEDFGAKKHQDGDLMKNNSKMVGSFYKEKNSSVTQVKKIIESDWPYGETKDNQDVERFFHFRPLKAPLFLSRSSSNVGWDFVTTVRQPRWFLKKIQNIRLRDINEADEEYKGSSTTEIFDDVTISTKDNRTDMLNHAEDMEKTLLYLD
ncbi:uncharacterized protein [Parasteatoda tepidariorum]|uniref:uncharacterized protein n=1 Tax=Parasteatoda tepidariorum TaxID=114398 RepID=UPI0039BD04EE